MQKKIYIICGPTASGKSAYAIKLATELDGEIINADSMQVYRGLEIITSQPSAIDRQYVPHHLYGIIPANHDYSVGIWLQQAIGQINDILAIGKTPILVGGTGMYISSLVYGIAKIPDVSPEIRDEIYQKLQTNGSTELHKQLAVVDPALASRLSPNDPQRISRGLEVYQQTGRPLSEWQKQKNGNFSKEQFHIIFINPAREILYNNINQRFIEMINNGLLDEIKSIIHNYDPEVLPKAIGLIPMISYLNDYMTLDEAINISQQLTRNYAKRQVTWFKNQLTYDDVISIQQFTATF